MSRRDHLLLSGVLLVGEIYKTIDPAGREDRVLHDHAGRVIRTIENYVDGDPSTGSSDEDVTVATT